MRSTSFLPIASILVGAIALALLGGGCKKDEPTILTPSTPAERPAIYRFKATPSYVHRIGDSVTLEWNVAGAAIVSIAPNVVVTLAGFGFKEVFVSETTEFILTATNSAGSVADTAKVTVASPLTITIHGSTIADSTIADSTRDGVWVDMADGTTYTTTPDGSISPPTVNGATTVVSSLLWIITGQPGANVVIRFTLPPYLTSLTGPRVPYVVNTQSAGWAENAFAAGSPYYPIDPRVANSITLINGKAAVQIGGTVPLPLGGDGNYTGTIVLNVHYSGLPPKKLAKRRAAAPPNQRLKLTD